MVGHTCHSTRVYHKYTILSLVEYNEGEIYLLYLLYLEMPEVFISILGILGILSSMY